MLTAPLSTSFDDCSVMCAPTRTDRGIVGQWRNRHKHITQLHDKDRDVSGCLLAVTGRRIRPPVNGIRMPPASRTTRTATFIRLSGHVRD